MKKIICILLIFVIIALCVGCSVEECETKTGTIEKLFVDGSGEGVVTFVDEKTGVNYLIFYGYRKGGITPRFNADGSLYVTERGE